MTNMSSDNYVQRVVPMSYITNDTRLKKVKFRDATSIMVFCNYKLLVDSYFMCDQENHTPITQSRYSMSLYVPAINRNTINVPMSS